MGSLIVFSGIDGAGKSTQIDLFVRHLKAEGRRVATVWSRGGYTPGMLAIKSLVRRVLGRRFVPPPGPSRQRTQTLSRPRTRRWWLRLSIIDMWWLYAVRVRWLRFSGRVVVCDRYWQDTLLDFQLNFPQERVERWWLWRVLERTCPHADKAFLMLIPLEESLARSAGKDEPYPDPLEMRSERLRRYQSWRDSADWFVLDGVRTVDDLATQIWANAEVAWSDVPGGGQLTSRAP